VRIHTLQSPHAADDHADELTASVDGALAEPAECLVCVFDPDGRIRHFNRACERATGFTRADVLGRDARDVLLPAEETAQLESSLARVRRMDRPFPCEGQWLTRDAERRLISWVNEPWVGPDGQIAGLLATGLDITERERKTAKQRLLMEEQAALRRVALLVAGGAEPVRIFQAVTEEACRLLRIPSAVMQRFEGEEATIVGRYSQHRPGGFDIGTVVPLEEGLANTKVARTGRPARAVYERGQTGVAARMRALGFRSTVAVPVIVQGRTWGALIAALQESETLPAETERRLSAFAELVAVALAGADARQALEASRARIVEAGDAARRRLERNLHDGAQQRLVSLALTLRLARAKAQEDPAATSALLAGAGDELSEALKELRELAHGLHPALLAERGLGPALEALAARASFPVELSIGVHERLPEPVEAAAYYLASEALANAAKHADPSSATVSVRREADTLLVEIADDGPGGADVAGGTGLRGLIDRIEALGGALRIESPPGSGTRLQARLPAPATRRCR
jgi:PAS domain S-box-containing protein